MEITQESAESFAQEWIAAWNSHDLAAILSHYAEDFEMSSPMIVKNMGVASGSLKGKTAVEEYWTLALQKSPELKFTLREVLWGANSIAIVYDSVRGLSNEIFEFSETGKVQRAYAHYQIKK